MVTVSKLGGEFLVNTETSGDQIEPSVTGLANGNFVVSWVGGGRTLAEQGEFDIKAQIFAADGRKIGGEFQVNSETFNTQYKPTVTGLANGGFVVSWEDASRTLGDASNASIKAQIFHSDGSKSGGEFLVNTQTESDQSNPTITSLANGGFVVSWSDVSRTLGDDSGSSIKAQIFNPDGTKSGTEFVVNTQISGSQFQPTITGLTNGGFVISWFNASNAPRDSDGSVAAQIFAADGTKVGDEFRVNTEREGVQNEPTIASLANGGFVVSWMGNSELQGGDSIRAQIYDQDGTAVGGEILVSPIFGHQTEPTITGLADGSFVVSWTDDSRTVNNADIANIHAQVFTANGTKLGEELLVNTQRVNGQEQPTITSHADGGFVVSWTDFYRDPLGTGATTIKAQIFEVRGDVLDGSQAGDRLTGTGFGDVLNGLKGNDILFGLGGRDTLEGGRGNDTLDGGAGIDTASYADASRAVRVNLSHSGVQNTVGAGNDILISIENLTGSKFDDTLTGDDGANGLVGGDGHDQIDGGMGADRLEGGFGNDRYYVDDAGDQVIESSPFGGQDTVFAASAFTLGDNVENLTLTGSASISGSGNALDNVVVGNAGDNRLNGGAGRDMLTGGLGADTFVFDSLVPQSRGDVIRDFVTGADHIALSVATFGALAGLGLGALSDGDLAYGNAATTPDQHLIYNSARGTLLYDLDGSGGADAVVIATLTGSPTLTAADIILI